jgi:hypothetical protein
MMRRLAATAALLFLPAAAAASFPAGSECAGLGMVDAVESFRRLSETASEELPGLDGQKFTLQIDDPFADRMETQVLELGKWRLMYRMGRNHVTEAWSWRAAAEPQSGDYYRYQYLPLGQRETEVMSPRVETDPAVGSYMVSIVRRDAYYFAFDNPYDFFSRNDADGGFAIVATLPTTGFALVVRGRYAAPRHSESTTYWRADPASRVDLTLKNRYFVGQLETLWFCGTDGRVLGTLGKQGK